LIHTVYSHSLSDLQSTMFHCEQFVIDWYNVDLLPGGGQHLLACMWTARTVSVTAWKQM